MNSLRPALGALLLLLWALPARGGGGRLEVWFIDVGQGDAAFASTPSGKTVLVDAGPPESSGRLARFLRSRLSGPIDVAVLTHPHADHVGGMRAALLVAGARHYYDPVLDHPSPILEALYRLVSDRSREGALVAHRVRAGATEPVDFGDGARLEFLAPAEPLLRGTRSDVNANSIVCRLGLGSVAVLFAADAERQTEARLLQARSRLAARVLKVAHHGSRHSTGAPFLRAVAPRLAIVSVGAGNGYGHPHRATLRRLQRAGVRVHRTDLDGTLLVRTDGREVELQRIGR